MKLGVSYNVFDGTELLEKSILQIRDSCFYINVVLQEKSNYLNDIKKEDLDTVNRLYYEKLIDEIIYFNPQFENPVINSNISYDLCHKNEIRKRKRGLRYCRENGCSHFISMDVDEFFLPSEFKTAIKIIEYKKYDATCCFIKDYICKPIYRMREYSNYYVPFIHDINLELSLNSDYDVYVDPTRRFINYKNFCLLDPDDIYMHHMSTVRKNEESLRWKYINSSAKVNIKNINKKVKDIINFEPNNEIDIVNNIFEIKF